MDLIQLIKLAKATLAEHGDMPVIVHSADDEWEISDTVAIDEYDGETVFVLILRA